MNHVRTKVGDLVESSRYYEWRREERARIVTPPSQMPKWTCALCKCHIDSSRVYVVNKKRHHKVCADIVMERGGRRVYVHALWPQHTKAI